MQAPGQGGTDRDWHVPPPGAVTGDAAAAGPAGPARRTQPFSRTVGPRSENTVQHTTGITASGIYFPPHRDALMEQAQTRTPAEYHDPGPNSNAQGPDPPLL